MPAKVEPINPKKRDSQKSFHISLKLALTLLQCLAMLPQEKIHGSVSEMYFSWKSYRTIYTLILMTANISSLIICFIDWLSSGYSINALATMFFYAHGFCTLILYLRLATYWSKLMRKWNEVDSFVRARYGVVEHLELRINVLLFTYVFLGLADYSLGVWSRYTRIKITKKNDYSSREYYIETFPQLFRHIEFNAGSAIFCSVLTVHATITWAMNDVFIIILSSALALNFKQLAKRLGDEVFKVKSDTFWQQIREDYDTLSNLCKEVNLNISHIIMLSYTTNIFFILVQLFHSLETNVYTDTISKVYFAFSFMYLFFKVVTVSLYSAWINEESKQPAYILTCLPSESYNIEISFDRVALTGCNLFRITKGLVLSENYNLVIPWVIGFITFMALEAVSMVYSNVLRDHVNREFDALCKAEVAFFISRAVINIFAISAVMKFSTLLQAGITWKGPEEIEL